MTVVSVCLSPFLLNVLFSIWHKHFSVCPTAVALLHATLDVEGRPANLKKMFLFLLQA